MKKLIILISLQVFLFACASSKTENIRVKDFKVFADRTAGVMFSFIDVLKDGEHLTDVKNISEGDRFNPTTENITVYPRSKYELSYGPNLKIVAVLDFEYICGQKLCNTDSPRWKHGITGIEFQAINFKFENKFLSSGQFYTQFIEAISPSFEIAIGQGSIITGMSKRMAILSLGPYESQEGSMLLFRKNESLLKVSFESDLVKDLKITVF